MKRQNGFYIADIRVFAHMFDVPKPKDLTLNVLYLFLSDLISSGRKTGACQRALRAIYALLQKRELSGLKGQSSFTFFMHFFRISVYERVKCLRAERN